MERFMLIAEVYPREQLELGMNIIINLLFQII